MNKFSFPSRERLKSRKLIAALYEDGKSVAHHQLFLKYICRPMVDDADATPVQVAFAVPKRKFKLAVDRNRIKRMLREALRHEVLPLRACLNESSRQLLMVINFTGTEKPKYSDLRLSMRLSLKKLGKKIDCIN